MAIGKFNEVNDDKNKETKEGNDAGENLEKNDNVDDPDNDDNLDNEDDPDNDDSLDNEDDPDNDDNPDNEDDPDNDDNPDNEDDPDNEDEPDKMDDPDNPDNKENTEKQADPKNKESGLLHKLNEIYKGLTGKKETSENKEPEKKEQEPSENKEPNKKENDTSEKDGRSNSFREGLKVNMSPDEIKKYNEAHGVSDETVKRPEGGRTPGEDAWDRRHGDSHYLDQED